MITIKDLDQIGYKRPLTLEELKIALLTMDAALTQIVKETTFDTHGNMKTGRKVNEIYNLCYGQVKNFIRNNPNFEYQKELPDDIMQFQMSHFYSYDYKEAKKTYQEKLAERQARNYYY